jgi:hypothetical protein
MKVDDVKRQLVQTPNYNVLLSTGNVAGEM